MRRVWDTVNEVSGGGNKTDTGGGHVENHEPRRKAGSASASRTATERYASA